MNSINQDNINVIEIYSSNKCYYTNMAQLHFFYWLVENNIYDYVYQNRDIFQQEIEKLNNT